MTEPAILEEIRYERITADDGSHIGWKPSDADRHRFDHGNGYTSDHVIRPCEPEDAARPLEDVRAELEAWAIGEPRLYDQLAALYAREPLIADRIAKSAVNGAMNGTLYDPTAFLASRLKPVRSAGAASQQMEGG